MVNKFTELDINQIKENLKEFLRAKPEFSDFNFDGASVNILLDLLSYNSAYLAFYGNQIANEMFLDSAILRNNIVSRAKTIGYVPHSFRAAKAQVQVAVQGLNASPSQVILPKYTEFKTRLENRNYPFLVENDVVFVKDINNQYINTVPLIQGKKFTYRFTVDSTLNENQRFILPQTQIDTTTITVKVYENNLNQLFDIFVLNRDLNLLTPSSAVYFLQENVDGKYELYFGDGVLGKRLENGNVVEIEYLETQGSLLNNMSVFTPISNPFGNANYTITTLESSRGGVDRELENSIKFKAPLFYTTQQRAVTAQDYESLLIKDFPSLEAVKVWGGQDNNPPRYGVVFCSAKPLNALKLNTSEKLLITNTILRQRAPVSFEIQVIDPDYLNIVINTEVKYDRRNSNLAPGQIQNLILNTVQNFATNNLNGFNTTFYYSKLVRAIDESNIFIRSNLTDVKLKYAITPALNVPQSFIIDFQTELDLGDSANSIASITSTNFVYRGLTSFFEDDGKGNISIYRTVFNNRVVVEANIGTVNYSTGVVTIPSVVIEGIIGNFESIFFTATPKEFDFSSKRNRFLLLSLADVNVTAVPI